jgi:4-hydroxy-tetrahydrodipicolinate synthase
MFAGVYTAIITPFRNDAIDYEAFEKLIEFQVASGVAGLVPMGTTGESPTVSHDEHVEVIRCAVKTARGRVQIIAGAGSNSTKEAVYLARKSQEAGADAVLSVNPYYNKPTQKGMIAHFAAVAESIDIPVMLYNIPGRCGVNFLPESMAELCEKSHNIRAMKEASGDITQMMRLHELLGSRIDILSGDDNLFLPLLSVGGKGVVSVLSNVLPSRVVEVYAHYEAGRLREARDLFYRLLPLCRLMFLETNPIPIKSIMAKAGWCADEIRMPLQSLDAAKLEQIVKAFEASGEVL